MCVWVCARSMWAFLMSTEGRGVVHSINMLLFVHLCACVCECGGSQGKDKNTFVILCDSEQFEVKSFNVRLNGCFCDSGGRWDRREWKSGKTGVIERVTEGPKKFLFRRDSYLKKK